MSKILANRYEILEKIGDGGMAVVYKARDQLLNRPVAIKVLRPEYVTDSNFVESFRKESRAAASLTHPNIVSIFDVGKDGNVYYIVMELVDGKPLSDIIRDEGALDYRAVLKISEQIASALSVAHRNNIIHRDVKPHNILITRDGHAKITDFGIARAVTDGTTVNDNTVKGTVHYFSPEQGRGMYMDERSDIYSLGIVMFEMLTGQVPFDADNAVAIAVMHMNDRITPPSKLVGGIPPALEMIILKATEKHQVNRFRNADEMLEALRNVDRLTGGFVDPRVAGAIRPPADDQVAYAEDSAGGNRGYDNGYDERYPEGEPEGEGYGSGYDEGYDTYQGGDSDEDAAPYAAAAGGAAANSIYYDEYDEDDEDDRKQARKKKTNGRSKDSNGKYKALGVIAGIVLAAVIAYFIVYPFVAPMLSGEKKETVNVEEVLGKSETDATQALEGQGFVVERGEDVFTTAYAIGMVAKQDPAADTPLQKGEKVTINISKGPEETAIVQPETNPDAGTQPADERVVVPEVTGRNLASAKYTLEAQGLKVTVVFEDSDTVPMDQVIRQNPESGSKVDKQSTVEITVSQGAKTVEVKMPDLLGQTESKARSMLSKVELLGNNVGEDYSDSYKKGTVIWQQYKKNTKLSKGQSVDYKISLGPKDKTSTVSIDISYDKAAADSFKLTVVLELSDGSEKYIINNDERLKSSGGETINITGSGSGAKVLVYFDDVRVKTYKVDFNKKEVSG